MSSFIIRARKNKHVRRLNKALESGVYAVNISGYMNEIESLHANKQLRRLKSSDLNGGKQAKRIIQAALQLSAYRSRVVEIRMSCMRVGYRLDEHVAALRKKLRTDYAPLLRSSYSTQDERNQALDYVLERAIRVQTELEGVMEYADLVIADLDQGSWTIKAIREAAQMTIDRAGTTI